MKTGSREKLPHYIKARKRTKRTIPYVLDENGIMKMGQKEIMHNLTDI